MSRLDAAEPIPVRVGDCLCANKPHDGVEGHDDGDIVYFPAQLSLEGGLAAQAIYAEFTPQVNAEGDLVGATREEMERRLGLLYLSQIESWNFLDDEGNPIPLTQDNIRKALPWSRGGAIAANKADDIYQAQIIDPLRERIQRQLSELGLTENLTSPSRPHPNGTRKRPRRSSPATSGGRRSRR